MDINSQAIELSNPAALDTTSLKINKHYAFSGTLVFKAKIHETNAARINLKFLICGLETMTATNSSLLKAMVEGGESQPFDKRYFVLNFTEYKTFFTLENNDPFCTFNSY